MSTGSTGESHLDLAEPVLEVRDLRRTFTGPPKVDALRNAHFTIRRGEFVAIVGPSGAGKSTLLNLLGMLDRPTSGSYAVRGIETSELSNVDINRLRSDVFGFVFQASLAIPERTVAANVDLPLRTNGAPLAIRRESVMASLTRVGIEHRINSRAGMLSGGELQRLAIARALTRDPDVILADEPTGNLDSKNAENTIALLKEVNSNGVTIVVVTHDDRVARAAGRVIHVEDGRTQELRPPCSTNTVSGYVSGASSGLQGTCGRLGFLSRIRKLSWEISDALYTLVGQPSRTLLLLLAMILGIGGLVSAQGVSASAAHQVSQLITAQALDQVTASAHNGKVITADQIARVANLNGVVGASRRLELETSAHRLQYQMSNGDDPSVSSVVAGPAKLLRLMDSQVTPTTSPALFDNDKLSDHVAIIGVDAAKKLGISLPTTGIEVWIERQAFSVVGIINKSPRDPQLLSSVMISDTAVTNTLHVSAKSNVVVRTVPGLSFPVSKALPYALSPTTPTDYSVSELPDLSSLRSGVSTSLDQSLFALAWILLIMSIVSIGAVMSSSVSTRRGEIGLRRAIGASKSSVARLFLWQGAALGLAGGVAGASIGVLATVALSGVRHWTPVLQLSLIPYSILLGILVGVIAALIPAWRAASEEPANAIRSI